MKLTNPIFTLVLLGFSASSIAAGSETNQSFSKAKKKLERSVYQDHREIIYCAASFDSKKNVAVQAGFKTEKHKKRAKRIEWVSL